jgi:uncharacterized protein
MRVAVAGSSGLIGSELGKALRTRGDEVVALARFGTVPWDVSGVDAVVNFAGANVAGQRWSEEYKKKILDSRVETTRALVEKIAAAKPRPKVLVNASAVGFYGGRGDEMLDETAAPGSDFLAGVVQRWEAEAQRAAVRSVQLRTGIVLSPRGGALASMLPPFKAFVGGPIGSGKQWFPFIHVTDEVAAILFAIDNDALSGPVNLVAPGIVTMDDFAKALGRALHRPSWARVPAGPLKMLIGEFAEVLLDGQRAVPRKLLDAGFQFRFPDVDPALRDVVS